MDIRELDEPLSWKTDDCIHLRITTQTSSIMETTKAITIEFC